MEWSIGNTPNLFKVKYGGKVEDEKKSFRDKLVDAFSKPKPEESSEQKIGEAISANLDPEKAKKFKFGG